MGPRPFSRGNAAGDVVLVRAGIASMGPRPFSRGNMSPTMKTINTKRCFNGAATFQPRKPELIVDGAVTALASMGPRPFSRGNREAFYLWVAWLKVLQWGRDLSAAETGEAACPATSPNGASMGPRPFSRGNTGRVEDAGGIQTRLQWGRDLSAAETTRVSGVLGMKAMLQWGRDLSAAETGKRFTCGWHG